MIRHQYLDDLEGAVILALFAVTMIATVLTVIGH